MLTQDAKRIKQMARKGQWNDMTHRDLRHLTDMLKDHLPKQKHMVQTERGYVEELHVVDLSKVNRDELISLLKQNMKHLN